MNFPTWLRVCAALPVYAALSIGDPVGAQITNDPFPDPIPASEGAIVVGVRDFAHIPDVDGAPPRPMLLVDEPGSGRLFVSDMWGIVYSIGYDGRVTRYLDLREPRWGVVVKRSAELAPIMEVGLQSFAFHPQFNVRGSEGYGRLYTWVDTDDRARTPDFFPGGGEASHDIVLLEWIARDPTAAAYDGGAPRDLLRVEEPFDNHNGGRIAFNPLASPDDADFGMLYLGLADGGDAGDPLGLAQDLGRLLGKMLRIDPLGSNAANGRYGIPADNPYARDANDGTLPEIFASGLRNPQGFDWDRTTGDVLLADIGQSVVEKLTRVPAGANLGWNVWEGSYRYASPTRVDMSNPRGDPRITYPVAEFDHQDSLFQRLAAASGVVVYRDTAIPELTNRVLWGDLTSGEVFHVPADGPGGGGQGAIRRLLFRDDGGPTTLLRLIQSQNVAEGRPPAARADLHFGRGPSGRVFILNKWDGVVREIVP